MFLRNASNEPNMNAPALYMKKRKPLQNGN